MSSDKRTLFEQLMYEVRRSQSATDRFDQAVADAIGVNRTDMRCLDVIQRDGRVPAGQLAAFTGLTTGAITTVIDRLEKRGLVRRVADSSDRRKVLVEIAPGASAGAMEYYGAHLAHSDRLYQRYNRDQIEFLLEFMRQGRELNEEEAARLEEQNRARDKSHDAT